MAKPIMIQGTMSNAGKSLLCAALCRIFRQDGYRVAPFKSQNMALNSYITDTGLCRIFRQDGYRVAPFKSQNMALNSYITDTGAEMGRAQVVQAEAAGIPPDVRMNPILLKPTTDVGSQVIVNGRPVGNMNAMEYSRRKLEFLPHIPPDVRMNPILLKPTTDVGSQVIVNGRPVGNMNAMEYSRRKLEFLPQVMDAYHSLAEENDIIVIEGAGSPAEINLRKEDLVNMGLARRIDAPVMLVGDIDRGGVFAQLYGTVALLEPEEKALVKATIINKFRGDPAILAPGLTTLEDLCGVPVAGVVPYVYVDIDEEDSLSTRVEGDRQRKLLDIAVIRLPRISNYTDFSPFERYANVSVRYVGRVRDLQDPDIILLPGTKSTIADLMWLRQSGLEAAILKAADAGCAMWAGFGICKTRISSCCPAPRAPSPT